METVISALVIGMSAAVIAAQHRYSSLLGVTTIGLIGSYGGALAASVAARAAQALLGVTWDHVIIAAGAIAGAAIALLIDRRLDRHQGGSRDDDPTSGRGGHTQPPHSQAHPSEKSWQNIVR